MTSQSLLKKRKKKRKYDDYKGLKLFEDTIKSDLQLQSSNSDDKPCREKELWIFQYPKDYDIRLLHQQEIQLQSRTLINKEGKDSYELLPCTASNPETSLSHNHVMLPSPVAGELVIGPPLQGCMTLLQKVNIPMTNIPVASAESKIITPGGLKKRWKPFGCIHKKPL